MHVKRLGTERDSQLLGPAAVRQQLLVSHDALRPCGALQQVGEDHRSVIAAHEVPLPATQGQEGEVLVTPALIETQTAEEEDQELLI